MLFRKRCRHLRPLWTSPSHINSTDKQTYTSTTCTHEQNLITMKEMHASYTVISMISTFAIKRFAMYLYIIYIYILYYYIYLSCHCLETACLINVARYLWMRILSGCLLNISLYSLRLNLMLTSESNFHPCTLQYLFVYFFLSQCILPQVAITIYGQLLQMSGVYTACSLIL